MANCLELEIVLVEESVQTDLHELYDEKSEFKLRKPANNHSYLQRVILLQQMLLRIECPLNSTVATSEFNLPRMPSVE